MNITEHNLPRANAAITSVTPIVFVVDDDASARESLASLIRSAGWHPKLLSSAQQFLALPRIHAPCCLLLAVDLPDLSGLDSCGRARHESSRDAPGLEVVAVPLSLSANRKDDIPRRLPRRRSGHGPSVAR